MTCREKYVLDNAVKFAEDVIPPGCPDDYGYLKSADVSDEFGHCIRSCKSCWNVEIPETDEIAEAEFIINPKEMEKRRMMFLTDLFIKRENERLITENVKLAAENERLRVEMEKLVSGKE